MDTYDLVRNYRKQLKLSQSEFSKRYSIPLSTLRKWEQKESKPSKYFIELISKEMNDKNIFVIEGKDTVYKYDTVNSIVYNNMGVGINIDYDIRKINKNNVLIVLEDLFNDYYKMMDKFNIQCSIDKKGNNTRRRL